MASPAPLSSQHSPNFLQLPLHSPQFRLILAGISLSRSKLDFSQQTQQQPPQRSFDPLRHVGAKEFAIKCLAEPAGERERVDEAVLDKDGDDGVSDDETIGRDFPNGAVVSQRISAAGDSISLGIREPVYEVVSRAALFTEFATCC